MASTTINTTAAEDARIVVAFGKMLGLNRNATQSEVKQAIIRWVTQQVYAVEQRAASEAAAAAVSKISPT